MLTLLTLAVLLTSVTDRSAAKARLLAKYRDPRRSPFRGAEALTCSECRGHILWVNPPAPLVPTVCHGCNSRDHLSDSPLMSTS